MPQIALNANIREKTGKRTREVRAQGLMPAVAYGHGVKPTSVQIALKEFEKVLQEAGTSTVIELKIGDDVRNVVIHDVQRDPVSGVPNHADFYQVRMDEELRAEVPLKFVGVSAAVKNLGGILIKSFDHLEVEALPKDLPHEIKVDLSKLEELDAKITLKELELPPGVKVLVEDLDMAVATVEPPRSEEELKALDEAVTEDVESVEGVKKPEEGEDVETEGKEGQKEDKPEPEAKGDKADKVVGKTDKKDSNQPS